MAQWTVCQSCHRLGLTIPSQEFDALSALPQRSPHKENQAAKVKQTGTVPVICGDAGAQSVLAGVHQGQTAALAQGLTEWVARPVPLAQMALLNSTWACRSC